MWGERAAPHLAHARCGRQGASQLVETAGRNAVSVFGPEREKTQVAQFFAGQTNGTFVEVGANEPVARSQTWHLEREGWTGILVEPQPWLAEKLRAMREASVWNVACGSPDDPAELSLHLAGGHSTFLRYEVCPDDHYVGEVSVPVQTLDSILEREALTHIDFLSIDVEGYEINVLSGFDIRRYRPRLVLLEDHVLSLKLHRHMLTAGYKLVRRTGLNNWYIPSDAHFALSVLNRLRLVRKMYVGTPLRRLRHRLKQRRAMR